MLSIEICNADSPLARGKDLNYTDRFQYDLSVAD